MFCGAEIASDLQQRKLDNLVFIMDGGLRSLPLAALHDGKQFLVGRYSVGMMSSISLINTHYFD
jgi:CHAT domain-containing protein